MSNANFTADPKTFCDNHALHPTDAMVNMRRKQEGYLSVPGDERVSWCRLRQNVPVGTVHISAMSNAWAAEISHTPPAPADAANWFPVYYLPWAASETFRTTLRSKQAGGGGHMIDPDFFITSAVDGCSVFIEGDRAAPTIYHANAYNPSIGAAPLGQAATPHRVANYWGPKTQQMENAVAGTHSPKSVHNNPALQAHNPSKVVHATDYMDFQTNRKNEMVTRETQGVKAEFKQNNAHTKKVRFSDVIYKPCGTVFGWRQGGLWTFYIQRRAILYYYCEAKQTGARFGKLQVPTPICREVVLSCDEFYPGGSGRVFTRPYNDFSMARAFQTLFG